MLPFYVLINIINIRSYVEPMFGETFVILIFMETKETQNVTGIYA